MISYLSPESISTMECSNHSTPRSSIEGDVHTTDCEADVESNMSIASESSSFSNLRNKNTELNENENISTMHTIIFFGSLFLVFLIILLFVLLPTEDQISNSVKVTENIMFATKNSINFQNMKACSGVQYHENNLLVALHPTTKNTNRCTLYDINMANEIYLKFKTSIPSFLLSLSFASQSKYFAIYESGIVITVTDKEIEMKNVPCSKITNALDIQDINGDDWKDIILCCSNQNGKSVVKIISGVDLKTMRAIQVPTRLRLDHFLKQTDGYCQDNLFFLAHTGTISILGQINILSIKTETHTTWLSWNTVTSIVIHSINTSKGIALADVNNDTVLDLVCITKSNLAVIINGRSLEKLFEIPIETDGLTRVSPFFIENHFYLVSMYLQKQSGCSSYLMKLLDPFNKGLVSAFLLPKLPNVIAVKKPTSFLLIWGNESQIHCMFGETQTNSNSTSNKTIKYDEHSHRNKPTVDKSHEENQSSLSNTSVKYITATQRLKKQKHKPYQIEVSRSKNFVSSSEIMTLLESVSPVSVNGYSPSQDRNSRTEHEEKLTVERDTRLAKMLKYNTNLQSQFMNNMKTAVLLFHPSLRYHSNLKDSKQEDKWNNKERENEGVMDGRTGSQESFSPANLAFFRVDSAAPSITFD